jgi:predicted permease
METLWQDLHYGIRVLLRNPGFTLVAILALALGIGSNTAIFSVVNAVLIRPLPYEDPDRLVMVWETNSENHSERATVSPPNFFDWRSQNRVFENITGIRSVGLNLTGNGTQPEILFGAGVSSDFFSMLGIKPAVGRTFLAEEDRPNGNRVAILGNGLWQRRFGADPGIVGKELTLDGKSFTVVGVTPASFKPPESIFGSLGSEIWIPLSFVDDDLTERNNHFLFVLGRLQKGINIDQAKTAMNVIAEQLGQQYPDTNRGSGVNLVPLKKEIVGDVRAKLFMLLGAVGFVLLIACANVANMLLARAAGRQKEIGIRLALGAGRGRIIRQLLTESVLLAVVSGLISLLLALWCTDVLVALSPDYIPRRSEIGIDANVLGFAMAVSILTGIIFGLAPALNASRPDISRSLKEGGLARVGLRGEKLRNLLVVSEVALSLVLLIGAGLMINSLLRLQRVNPGFNPDKVLAMRVSLSPKYSEPAQQIEFFKQLVERIEALPGAKTVGAINDLPFSGNQSITVITVEGSQPVEQGKEPRIEWRQISPNYFRTMEIPLIVGRDFTLQDNRSAAPVAIINQTMARKHWPDQNPVGRRFKFGGSNSTRPWVTIVGVAGDIKHLGLNESEGPALYISYLFSPRSGMYITVKSALEQADLLSAMQKEVWAIDRDQPVGRTATMNELLSRSVSEPRFYSLLLGIFAFVALAIAAVGIYGVMSYSVTQRTHEIGIRMALGAQPGDVLKLVLGKSLLLVLIGIGIGLTASAALTQALSSLLFGVTPTDPATFTGISLLLSSIALLASYIPARRATKVDPMVALRYE